MRLRLIQAVLAALFLAACGGSNAVKSAQQATADNRAETIAFALYADFVVIEELAADVKDNPATPQSVKDALKRADAIASPIAERLRYLANEVQELRAVAVAGGTGAESIAAKLVALNLYLTEAAPQLRAFTDEFNKARKGTQP